MSYQNKQIQEIQKLYKQYLGKRTLDEYLQVTRNSKAGDEETTTDPLFRDMIESKVLWGYNGDKVLLQQQKHKIVWNNEEQTAKPDFETNNEFCKVPILFDAKSSNISHDEMTSGINTVYESTFKRYLLGIKPGYRYIIGFNLEYIFLYERVDEISIKIRNKVHIGKLLQEDKTEIENFVILMDETKFEQITLEDKITILKNKKFEDTPFNTELFFEKYVNTRNKLQRFFIERLEANKINKDSCDDYIKSDLPNSDNDGEFRTQLANRLTMIEFFKYIFIRTYEDFGLIHFSEEDKKIIPVSYGKVMDNLISKKGNNGLFNDFPFEDYIDKISKQGITDIGKEFFDGFSTLFKKYEGFIEDLIVDQKAKYNYYHVLFDIIFFLNEFNFKELGDDIIGGLYEKTLDREDRKKFGQFYTPRYIINFIIDTLAIKPKEDIKIADISCGTGGFLVKYLDKIKGDLLSDTTKLADIFKGVYGVDIKEFSILLTRLNIALMFILKNKALKDYNIESKKIRLNSVIQGDGLGIQNTVPFKDGELDFVVGNPPYVGQKGNSEIFDGIKGDSFYKELFTKRSDLYYYFIIDGIKKLKEGGKLGYIIPREWITSDSGYKLRQYILKNCKILSIIDFNGISIFEDAGTTSCILFLQKGKKITENTFSFVQFKDFEGQNLVKYIENNKKNLHKTSSSNFGEAKQKIDSGYEIFSTKIMQHNNFKNITESIEKGWKYDISNVGGLTTGKIYMNDFITVKKISQENLGETPWLFGDKIKNSHNLTQLGNILKVAQGVITGCDNVMEKHILKGLANKDELGRGIFVLQEGSQIRGIGLNDIINNVKDIGRIEINLYEKGGRSELNNIEKSIIKPLFGGKDLRKWSYKKNVEWLIYYNISNYANLRNDNLPILKKHFSQYKAILINRNTLGGKILKEKDIEDFSMLSSLYNGDGSTLSTLGKGLWFLLQKYGYGIEYNKEKIITSSRANGFCYSEGEIYGLSGLNYIFIDPKCGYTNTIDDHTNRKDYLKFIVAVLNSSYMMGFLKSNKLNAITGTKIKEQLYIPLIEFEKKEDMQRYTDIIILANQLIALEQEEKITISLKKKGDNESVDFYSDEGKKLLTEKTYSIIDSAIGLEVVVGNNEYIIIGGDHEEILHNSSILGQNLGKTLGIVLYNNGDKEKQRNILNKKIDDIVYTFYNT